MIVMRILHSFVALIPDISPLWLDLCADWVNFPCIWLYRTSFRRFCRRGQLTTTGYQLQLRSVRVPEILNVRSYAVLPK